MIDNITTLTDAQAIAKFRGKYEKQIRENTSETLLNSVTLDGFLYGVPFTTNTWFMYYDKRVFPEKDIKSLEKCWRRNTSITGIRVLRPEQC